MKVLVTGANGFVGGHLVRRLLREGLQVACLVRPTADAARLGTLPVQIRADPMDCVDGLAKCLAGHDIIFHVAGLTRGRSAGEYMRANAELTGRLVEAAALAGPGRTPSRFVYVSSLAAVGPNPTAAPLDETCPPRPHDHYGRSKLAGERIVLDARDRLPVTIVRPPGVYGPGDTNLLAMFRTAQRLGLVPSIGERPGRAKLFSLVHVDDLAEGIWLAAASPAGIGRTYFIAGGTHTTAELAAALSSALGRPLRVLNLPRALAVLVGELGQLKWALTGRPQIVSRRKVRDLLQPRWTCAWDLAARDLGYRPRIALDDGIRRTARWYAREGWIGPIGP